MNADFNYENYQFFYEEREDEEDGEKSQADEASQKSERANGQGGESKSGTESEIGSHRDGDNEKKKQKKKSKAMADADAGQGLHDVISESNLLYQMESKVRLDPAFMKNYEQWLEDEVWSYFD